MKDIEGRGTVLNKYSLLAKINIVLGLFSLWFIGIVLGIFALVNVNKAKKQNKVEEAKLLKRVAKHSIILFVITVLLVALNMFVFYSYIDEIGGWNAFVQEMNQPRD